MILPSSNARPNKRVHYSIEVIHGKSSQTEKTSRVRHSDEYKSEALKLAEKVGVGAAAVQLGLHESPLYAWRKKA